MRPTRKSIWDNFTPEQSVFIDALLETMPGAKLSVVRSRRVQTAQLPLFGLDAQNLGNWRRSMDRELDDALYEWPKSAMLLFNNACVDYFGKACVDYFGPRVDNQVPVSSKIWY